VTDDQETARCVLSTDWSKHPLGPLGEWPPEIRLVLSTLLNNRLPMAFFWGEEAYFFYNDAFLSVLDGKHPWAMGRPGREVWAEAWDVVGPQLEQVRRTGRATRYDDQRVAVRKNGVLVDAYFTYSFSAVFLGDGRNAGTLVTAIETTAVVEHRLERQRAHDRLEHREMALRALANTIPQLAWIADASGAITWYNQRWYDYTGTRWEEMRRWGWRKTCHPEHLERVEQKFRAHVASGEPWEDTFPLRSATGEWRWFLARAEPLRNERGADVRWFGSNTDIEEQQRLLREIDFQKRRFETAMQQLPVAVIVGEAPSGKLIFANHKMREVWGHDLIPSQSVAEYAEWVGFHPDGRRFEAEEWPLARSLRTGEIVTEEDVAILRGDGKRGVVRLSSAPVRDGEGRIVAGVLVCQDVTEALASTRLLRESEKLFREVLDHSGTVVFLKDLEGRHLFINRRFEKLCGVNREAVLGKTDADIFPAELAARFRESDAVALQRKEPLEVEEELHLPGAPRRTFVIVKFVVTGADGAPIGVCGIGTDITERKRAEVLASGQAEVFRRMAEGAPLERVLEQIVLTFESQIEDATATILLLAPDGAHLVVGAAPTLPAELRESIQNFPLGHYTGPCGAAAFLRQRILAQGVPTDPRWNGAGALAQRFGIDTCWSEPILNHDGSVLGTFAVYFRTRRTATEGELATLRKAADLAQVAIGRSKALRSLEESEKQFRSLADAMPQIVWISDDRGRVSFFNRRWTEYTGLTPEAGLAEGAWQMLHPHDVTPALDRWRAAVESIVPFQHEFRIRRHNGEYRWFLTRAVPIRDTSGRVTKWFGTSTDIHDQKRLLEASRESEAQVRALAESLPLLVWRATPDGVTDYWNRKNFEYYGLPGDANIAQEWTARLHPDDRDRVLSLWTGALTTGQPFEAEARLRRSDGQYRWHLAQAAPGRGPRGDIRYWYGSATDIEEQKRIQREFELALRARDEFLSIASHELKTPLTSLRLQSQMLQRDIRKGSPRAFDPDRIRQLSEQTDRNVNRLMRLVDDVLDIACIRSGRLSIQPEPFELC
jgi:PAS domain S-box-containing protein